MEIVKANQQQIKDLYKAYHIEIGFGIDGYLDRLLSRCDSYVIINKEVIAIFTINGSELCGLFVLKEYRTEYESILSKILDKFSIKQIYLSTSDGIFLSEILRRGYPYIKTTYNFTYPCKVTTDFKMKLAIEKDYEEIANKFGKFLKYNDINIKEEDIYINTNKTGKIISLGLYENFKLTDKSSVAMIVDEDERKKGYGTKTLQFIVQLLQAKNIEVNARCWFHNEISKKTLLKAGFVVSNLVIRTISLEENLQLNKD